MGIVSEQSANKLLADQKEFFRKGKTLDVDFRISQLKKLKQSIIDNQQNISNALYKDLGKSDFESYTSEIGFVLHSITHTIKNLKKWAKPKKKKTPISLFLSKSVVINQPYGSVYIIGPYNYPFQLLIEPLIGALAAGNCAVISASELTPTVAKVVDNIIKTTFSKNYVAFVDGGIENNTILLNKQFDYIFFTGSINVGKVVMATASKNLTPMTLELGGKSPVIVDKSCNIKVACERIVWGKFMNVGQTCVAPDYVFVDNNIKKEFLNQIKLTIEKFYGNNIKESKDYGRIVNDKHMQRLANIIHQDEKFLFFGGDIDTEKKYISPTILTPDDVNAASMQQEIFGPILPILGYDDVYDAISYISENPKPLALYVFSDDKKFIKNILNNTSSGGVSINDTISHIVNPNLPFGGVGSSGFGEYHGEYSFKTFSHQRSVLQKSTQINITLAFPPFTDGKLNIIKKILK